LKFAIASENSPRRKFDTPIWKYATARKESSLVALAYDSTCYAPKQTISNPHTEFHTAELRTSKIDK
jgi:hypothetical protein